MAKVTVRKVGVFSVAKIQSIIMCVIGLLIGVIYGLAFMIFGAFITGFAPRDQQAAGGISTILIGLVMMIAFPILYAILGFIGGAVGGLVYNIAAGVVGGIKLEVDSSEPGYIAPPAPQWQQPNQR
jgi:hypothetical protein